MPRFRPFLTSNVGNTHLAVTVNTHLHCVHHCADIDQDLVVCPDSDLSKT